MGTHQILRSGLRKPAEQERFDVGVPGGIDDCLMGPAVQDIWMLLSGDSHQMTIQLQRILKGYREFHDFNVRELHLIEALRTLRMLHYAAWLAKRWEDPAFPLNFPWFNTGYYWQEQIQNMSEQINLLEDPHVYYFH